MTARRYLTIFAALLVALGLAACGRQAVAAPAFRRRQQRRRLRRRRPVTYQLQISRELNQYSERGLAVRQGPAARRVPAPWHRRSCGTGSSCGPRTRPTSPRRRATTSRSRHAGQHLTTRSSSTREVNPFAWTAQTLEPRQTEPGPVRRRQRPHPGRPAAVQAQHHGLQQPAADAVDPRRRGPAAGRDLAEPLVDDDCRPAPGRVRLGSLFAVAVLAASLSGALPACRAGEMGSSVPVRSAGNARRPRRRSWPSPPPAPPRRRSGSRTSTRRGPRRRT